MFVLASHEFISLTKRTVVPMTKMKAQSFQTILFEKYSSDECDSQESSEEVKSSGDDGSFENETLGNHIASQSDISRDHCLHDQGQYEHHYASLHFNNPPRGYISKMCEMYYGSKTCPFGGNQGAWNHTGIKF